MRLSSIIIAISGLAVSGGSVFVAKDYLSLQSSGSTQAAESAIVKVAVASRDISLGSVIEGQMVTTIDWPRGSVPAGVFTDLNTLIPPLGGDPRRAKRAIDAGELILANRVSDFGEKVTIVQSLADGYRAMAIEVAAETAVGGFVTPGDFVDILLTHGKNETLRAVTILQNIRVIGVDQSSDERADAPEVARTVTLEVSPDAGQRLALAQQAGTLSLSLRTQAQVADEPLSSIRLSDLLQELSPVPENVKTTVISVRRGNVLNTVTQ